MAKYIAKFIRYNFGVTPELKQTADVYFETDINEDDYSNEDDYYEAFYDVMWKAMWKQNPHWVEDNCDIPDGLDSGWSSVMQDGEVVKIQ